MERSYETAQDMFECIKGRYSCRRYTDRHIDDDLLRELISAGLCAPTGGNLQPYSIITVRKSETKKELAKLCGQSFIAKADVNLVFILDWSKIKNYAVNQDAPFVANNSFVHNLIAFADVVCAAQIIEMAASMSGLGTCIVGNILGNGTVLSPLLNLPYNCYPVLMLSMGYPDLKSREYMRKATYEAMVFSEAYPDDRMSLMQLLNEKYCDMSIRLPKNEEYAGQWFDNIEEALLTTYSNERTDEILSEIKTCRRINEMQRRFCLKYASHKSVEESDKIKKDMMLCGIKI